MKLNGVLLLVKDIKKATTFYKEVMELNVSMDIGDHVAFENGFGLQANYEEIVSVKIESKHQSNKFQLYFEVDDIEAWYNKIKKEDTVVFLHSIKEYSWGQRSFRFFDYDQNIIEIAEHMDQVVLRFLKQGLSVEETSVRTMFPVEYIKQFTK